MNDDYPVWPRLTLDVSGGSGNVYLVRQKMLGFDRILGVFSTLFAAEKTLEAELGGRLADTRRTGEYGENSQYEVGPGEIYNGMAYRIEKFRLNITEALG